VLGQRKDPGEVSVGDVLTRSPVTVTPDMSISDARQLMAEHQVRRLPVTKNGSLVGVLALGDVAVVDPSKRAVGEALEQISDSDSTRETTSAPPRGRPARSRTA
jgi:CBS-domain-containing membrane protein